MIEEKITATKVLRNIFLPQLIPNMRNMISSAKLAVNPMVKAAKKGKYVDDNWNSLDFKLSVVPGKQFLSKINQKLQEDYKISLTYDLIIKNISSTNIPNDLKLFLVSLDNFCID